MPSFTSQNLIHQGICPPLICYNCEWKGHIISNCFNIYSSAYYIQGEYYVNNIHLYTDAVLSYYYDQNWYFNLGSPSYVTSQHDSLELTQYS
jgi:hypothetical protein